MGFDYSDYLGMKERTDKARGEKRPQFQGGAEPAECEVGPGGLQGKILEWCGAQWPRWKVDYARSDKRSGRPEGAHDFTVFAPGGRPLLVEVKARDEKVNPKQRVWHKELELCGYEVKVVRSMDEWLALVEGWPHGDRRVQDCGR